MDTKKSNVNTGSQQKGKKAHSGAALGAGMTIASVAGATVGMAFNRKSNQDDVDKDDVLVDVVPEEEIAEELQQEQEQEPAVEPPTQDTTPGEESAGSTDQEQPTEEQQEEDDLEKDPDDVTDKILSEDDIDDPEYGNDIHPIEMRNITDANGNEMEAMIFEDEDGYQFALCQSDPGSGIFDKVVDPYTLESIDLPQEISYTRTDFEELLHDDGSYIAPESNGPLFADNDDISQDIKTTDDGEMVAQNEPTAQEEPDIDINIDIDDIEPEMTEADEDLVAQMLNDDSGINEDDVEVDGNLIELIEGILEDEEHEEIEEEVPNEEEPEDEEAEEDLDDDEIDEDDLDFDED